MRQDVYIYKDGVTELRRPRDILGRQFTEVVPLAAELQTLLEPSADPEVSILYEERRWYKEGELHGVQVFKEI